MTRFSRTPESNTGRPARTGVYIDRLRAILKAGKDGSYRFETEWPNMPSPHVHFRVSAPRYKPLLAVWPGDERRKEADFDLVLEPARSLAMFWSRLRREGRRARPPLFAAVKCGGIPPPRLT